MQVGVRIDACQDAFARVTYMELLSSDHISHFPILTTQQDIYAGAVYFADAVGISSDTAFNFVGIHGLPDNSHPPLSMTFVMRANDTSPWVEIAKYEPIPSDLPYWGSATFGMNVGEQTLAAPRPQFLTTAQQTTLTGNFNADQRAVIDTLPIWQQAVFASGTSAQKNAIIITLTPTQQAVLTGARAEFIQTVEQINADKLTLEQITYKLRNGQFISDDESVFFALGNSLMSVAAMAEIDAGRGFDGLRNIGLTQAQALKVLSIYNVTLETSKYDSEKALALLEANSDNLALLKTYLASLNPPLTLPPLTAYSSTLRANHSIYAAIANWTGT